MTISQEELIKLAELDVLSNPPTNLLPENIEIEKKIKVAIKDATFSMKLTQQQVAMLERFASVKRLKDWKEYLTQEIQETILKQEGRVAHPLIDTPTFASGSKVTGPSLGGLVTRA
jgi:hypothetical protein